MTFHIPEPAVDRRILLRTSAAVWFLVGLGLAVRSGLGYAQDGHHTAIWLAPLAAVLGWLKGHFALAPLARRNVARIRALSPHKEKICLFAFQSLQSFAVIGVMIGLGVVLRHLPLRRDILASLYLLIGVALTRGSLAYAKN